MKATTIKLIGRRPLIMHADTLVDPLHPATVEHKKMTSTKTKTDALHRAIARSEWNASMYRTDELGPALPAHNILACIRDGAKKARKGPAITEAVVIVDHDLIRLDYDGPRDLDGLWEAGFTDARTVVVNRARVIRYRPCFREWSLTFQLAWDPDTLSEAEVLNHARVAGARVGMGDHRPTFGRFNVEQVGKAVDMGEVS